MIAKKKRIIGMKTLLAILPIAFSFNSVYAGCVSYNGHPESCGVVSSYADDWVQQLAEGQTTIDQIREAAKMFTPSDQDRLRVSLDSGVLRISCANGYFDYSATVPPKKPVVTYTPTTTSTYTSTSTTTTKTPPPPPPCTYISSYSYGGWSSCSVNGQWSPSGVVSCSQSRGAYANYTTLSSGCPGDASYPSY